jgi:hypothetical protein
LICGEIFARASAHVIPEKELPIIAISKLFSVIKNI